MAEFVDQDQVARADEGRRNAEIGEIARAEDEGGLLALVPGEPLLQRRERGELPVTSREAPAPAP